MNSVRLFIVSALMLFLELACIRWCPAYARLLTFFSNFVLLGCFLGISTGFLISKRTTNYLLLTPIWFLCLVAFLHQFYVNISLNPEALGSNIYYGAEYHVVGLNLPFPVVVGVFFLLLALMFVGLGQVTGRLFEGLPPLRAYCVNIGGSVAGSVLFGLCSWAWLNPGWWFGGAFCVLLYLVWQEKPVAWVAIASIAAVLSTGVVWQLAQGTYWSPYYKIAVQPEAHGQFVVNVNEIGHQEAVTLQESFRDGYPVPFLLQAKAGGSLADVLVIGAGSGNDVANALACGAGHVDAVEIDPVVADIGRRLHPEHPYASDRVTQIITDGRNYLHDTPKQYDMIVYGLVDSLALFSSFSSVRLESWVYTREAFADARRHLKPGGLLVVYNHFRKGWLVARIADTMQASFDQPPLVMAYPPLTDRTIQPDADIDNKVMMMEGNIGPIQAALAHPPQRFQFVLWPMSMNFSNNGFGTMPPPNPDEYRLDLQSDEVAPNQDIRLVTDDWPFVYMRYPSIAQHYLLGLGLVLGMSLIFLATTGNLRGGLSAHYFFLGTGFMLLETVGVVRMSLLFGATWVTNMVVFTVILLLILAANALVMTGRVPGRTVLYAGLFCCIALNFFVSPDRFLGVGAVGQYVLAPLSMLSPMFFAGMIFATSFSKETSPDTALGANVLGAMAGGMLEYLSLVTGYTALLGVLAGAYLLSWLALRRR